MTGLRHVGKGVLNHHILLCPKPLRNSERVKRIPILNDGIRPEPCIADYEASFGFLILGCLAQACDSNSSESCTWKFSRILSSELPGGEPEGSKTHAHSEQPQFLKLCSQTSLRPDLSWA